MIGMDKTAEASCVSGEVGCGLPGVEEVDKSARDMHAEMVSPLKGIRCASAEDEQRQIGKDGQKCLSGLPCYKLSGLEGGEMPLVAVLGGPRDGSVRVNSGMAVTLERTDGGVDEELETPPSVQDGLSEVKSTIVVCALDRKVGLGIAETMDGRVGVEARALRHESEVEIVIKEIVSATDAADAETITGVVFLPGIVCCNWLRGHECCVDGTDDVSGAGNELNTECG